MPLAFIHFLDGMGRPVDPGFGVGGGGEIDNTLPVPNPDPGTPGHLPSVPPGWPVYPSRPIYRPPPVDPGFGHPGMGHRPVDPGFGVDLGGHPIQPLPNPPPGQPGHLPGLPPKWPVIPSHPWVPGHGMPGHGHPDQGLPEGPPPTVPPGMIVVLVRSPEGKWYYAMVPAGDVKPVPPPPTAAPKST